MANKISGTGNSVTRLNEITADDVATLRNYIIGSTSGVISTGEAININEVIDVTFEVNDNGELIVNEPDDYQGTIFSRNGDELIATTANGIAEVRLKRVENYLIAEGGFYFE